MVASPLGDGRFGVRVTLRAVLSPEHAANPDPEQPRVMVGEAALGVLAADGEGLETLYNPRRLRTDPKVAGSRGSLSTGSSTSPTESEHWPD